MPARLSAGIEPLLRIASSTPEARRRFIAERAEVARDLDDMLSAAEVALLATISRDQLTSILEELARNPRRPIALGSRYDRPPTGAARGIRRHVLAKREGTIPAWVRDDDSAMPPPHNPRRGDTHPAYAAGLHLAFRLWWASVFAVGFGLPACSLAPSHPVMAPPPEPTEKRPELSRTVTRFSQPPTAPSVERCFWDDGTSVGDASTIREHVARLSEVRDMPYICEDLCVGGVGCGDGQFWRVVRDGRDAIPYLLDVLEDSTPTEAVVPNVGGHYAVGDVALVALEEIVHGVPVFEWVPLNEECGVCSWWHFVRSGRANRKFVKNKVATWIRNREAEFLWRTDGRIETGDCVDRCPHPAGGYFEVEPKP